MSGTFGGNGLASPYQTSQFAPQGLFGDLISKLAAPAGGAIGNLFGNQQLGTRIGTTAGQLAHFLPLSAGPQQAGGMAQDGQQQLDPQFLGGLVNLIRQAAQAAQQGAHILETVRQAAPGLLPLALGPDQQQAQQQQMGGQQMAPQGLFGDLIGKLAAPAGGAIGNLFGRQQLGSQIGNVAGQLAHFLPLSAGPQMGGQQMGGQQMAPQGLFGDLISKLAAPAGGAIGNLFGNQQLGTRIGTTAGQLAHFLPLSAGPQQAGGMAQDGQQQLDPQFLGGLVNLIRQAAQAAQQGAHILETVRQAAPGLLPLALGPDQQQAQQQQMGGQQMGGQQMAPQGLFGDLIGKLAAPAGGAIGNLFGRPQLGSQIGNVAGQLAHFLPLSAGPQQAGGMAQDGQQQLDPQFLGGLVNLIRQAAQAAQQGAHILETVRQAAPGLLPLALGPDPQQAQQQQMGGQQMAPQGLFGDLIGKLAAPAGGAIGNLFGHQQLGSQIGTMAGQFAHYLPLSAGPQMGMGGLGTLH